MWYWGLETSTFLSNLECQRFAIAMFEHSSVLISGPACRYSIHSEHVEDTWHWPEHTFLTSSEEKMPPCMSKVLHWVHGSRQSHFNYIDCNVETPVTYTESSVIWYGSVMRDTERRPWWSTLLITQQGVKWEFLIPEGDHQKINDLELQAADKIA